MRIERAADAAAVAAATDLFDEPPQEAATARFLSSADHHLLLAYEGDRAVGMISGVETTHPDKGTEMFVYELGVDEDARRRGVATALVHALATLAKERGCYGMWVGVDTDNVAALATYRRAGAHEEAPAVVFSWEFPRPG